MIFLSRSYSSYVGGSLARSKATFQISNETILMPLWSNFSKKAKKLFFEVYATTAIQLLMVNT